MNKREKEKLNIQCVQAHNINAGIIERAGLGNVSSGITTISLILPDMRFSIFPFLT